MQCILQWKNWKKVKRFIKLKLFPALKIFKQNEGWVNWAEVGSFDGSEWYVRPSCLSLNFMNESVYQSKTTEEIKSSYPAYL